MTIIDRRYSVAEGQAIKTPCKAATTANITMSGEQIIDGVALTETSPPTRVLVKDQSNAVLNGIYDVSTGNWTRTKDFDGAYDIVKGTAVYITDGTVNARYIYLVSTANPITVDTTSITFVADQSSAAIASAAAALASQVAAASSASSASSSASSASTSSSTATAAAALIAPIVPSPQGYLTLTSATPIIPSDVSAATSVYYTPYIGNTVPIYNGALFVPTVFAELTLAMNAAHAASNIYDVFVFSNSGVLTIATGPSWSAGTSGSITAGSCARGTGAGGAALSRVSGIYTNAVQITGRNGATTYTIAANLATYVGSIFMDGTNGQISCHRAYGKSRKWGVWNAYNRAPIYMQEGDSTASWSSSTTYPTFAAQNADATNAITTFTGLAEEQISCTYNQHGQQGAVNRAVYAAMGLNSTTTMTGSFGRHQGIGSEDRITVTALATIQPALGINNIQALGASDGVTVTFQGTQPFMQMTTSYRG